MPIDGAAGDISSFFTQFQTVLLDRMDGAQPGQTGPADKAKKNDTVGPGNTGSPDPSQAPDPSASTAPATGGAIMAAVLMSLGGIMPSKESSDDIDAKLASVEAKMKDTNNDINKGAVTMDQARKREAIAQKLTNLADAEKHSDKAAGEHKKMSLADKFKLAFSYIGAILTVVVGIIAIATGVGAVAGALLIAGGVMMLAMAVDQTMQDVPGKDGAPGKGFIQMSADAIAKDKYPNDPDKQAELSGKLAMGFNIALMGASMICSIVGSIINPTGVEAAVTELPEMIGDVETLETGVTDVADATTAVDDATTATSDATTATNDTKTVQTSVSTAKNAVTATSKAKTGVGIAEGVNDAANAGADTASQTYSYLADNDTAAATGDKADNKAIEALTNMIDAQLDALMAQMKASGERFNTVISSMTEAMKDHGDSLAHVKFRA